MKSMQALATLAFLVSVSAWDYTKSGQKLWGNEFPYCAGKEQKDPTYVNMQSPIDIPKGKGKKPDNQFKKGKYLPDLVVDVSDSVTDVTIHNENGYFLKIDGFNGNVKLNHGGLVQNDYYLSHMEIHWPSEHKMNGKKYKGEFQIFFSKAD